MLYQKNADMHNFEYIHKYDELLDKEILSLVAAIHECRGRYAGAARQVPKTFEVLAETAKIQSADASNRIEGIVTKDNRIKKLVNNKLRPQNLNEREILGYSSVLDTIYESYQYVPVNTGIILQFHRDMLKVANMSHRGQYKITDNVIAEHNENGNENLCFKPVPAALTPDSMEQLCSAYNSAIQQTDIDELLIIPMFILDFLCIHPFKDGNGRMSRLLTLLLLYKAGYIVGRYISIEKLIAESKSVYYDTLYKCSQGWNNNKNTYKTFVKYILQIILMAYNDLLDWTEIANDVVYSKPERVENYIKQHVGPVTKAIIGEALPDISQSTIQTALYELVKQHKIKKLTSGRYASYVWNWDNKE